MQYKELASRKHLPETGVLVRAQKSDGTWTNADIVHLSPDSLLGFLRSRGGENEWAESLVFMLLAYTPEDLAKAIEELGS